MTLRQRAALECPTFPVNPREFRVPEEWLAAIFVCHTIHQTRWAPPETFFDDPPAPEGPTASFFTTPRNLTSSPCDLRSGNTGNTMRLREGVRREPQSSTIPTLRFTRSHETWNPLYRTGRTYSRNCLMEVPRYPTSELHFGKFQDSNDFQ